MDLDDWLVNHRKFQQVECIVDMDEKKLAFALNGEDPVECGITLPENGVRPWCFLYHEGDSITIEETC